MHLYVIVVR